jgi:hypothetical protein
MLTATQIIEVATYYRTQSNTYGHVATVLERRPCGDKTEAAWEPLHRYGNELFGTMLMQPAAGYYKGETIGVDMQCFFDPKAAVREMEHHKLYGAPAGYTYRLKRYMLPQPAAEAVEATNTWKAREAQRFTDGTYTPLPWADEAWFKTSPVAARHFAHVSVEDPGKIAFTRDDIAGRANTKTRMSAGRYLRDYYSDELYHLPRRETGGVNVHGQKITVDALNHYARTFTKTYGGGDTLAFATTREDMVRVYLEGPNSCMAHPVDHYQSAPVHPVEVYAAGDLQLAYLTNSDQHITARALVWPEKMTVGRIYGDEVSLQAMLSELGYAMQDGCSLYGARLLKIPHGDGYVMPYVDGDCTYGRHKADPTFFQIGGDECAELTIGLDHDPEACACTCDHCGDGMSEDEIHTAMVTRYESVSYCYHCHESNTFTCDWSQDQWSLDADHTTLANGEIVANRYLSHYGECAVTGDWYREDDLMPYTRSGEQVSQDGIDQDDLVADEDGNYWQADDLAEFTAAVEAAAVEAA